MLWWVGWAGSVVPGPKAHLSLLGDPQAAALMET